MSLVEIEDFNALIVNGPFFDQPVKTKQEAYEKLVEITRNKVDLLDYLYHQNYYKRIDICLSRQTNPSIRQQVNFTGN